MGRSETPTFRNLVHKSDRVQYIPKSFRFFVVFESRHDHVISGYHLSQSSHHRTSPPPLWYFSWFVSHHFVILQFFVEIVFIKPLYFAQKSCFFFWFWRDIFYIELYSIFWRSSFFSRRNTTILTLDKSLSKNLGSLEMLSKSATMEVIQLWYYWIWSKLTVKLWKCWG